MQAPRQILQGFNFLIPNGLLLKQAWLTTVIKVNLAMKRLLVQHILVAKKKKQKPKQPYFCSLGIPRSFLGRGPTHAHLPALQRQKEKHKPHTRCTTLGRCFLNLTLVPKELSVNCLMLLNGTINILSANKATMI